jgi:exonuclease SbcC
VKPVRLLMSAFGPYSQEQLIDFRALGGQRFFLIHGPTGSGKTTILDAICYALFGESSGNERDGEQMRSHFAPPSTPTFVEFDFTVGERMFRARRRPRQQRPKKGGEGTTADPASATLWEVTGAGEGLHDGVVLAAQPHKVTAEVERIFGFGVEQFRQVILLPQDKFRDLLMADSSRREDILQTLFQTQLYEQLQERLKERARELRTRVEQVNHEVDVLLNQAGSTDLDELRVIRAARADETATLAGVVVKLKQDEETAHRRLQAGRADKEKLDEQDAAHAEVARIERNAPAIDADRRSADAAKRASTLAPHEALLRERRQQEKSRRDMLQAAERTLAVAAAAHETALAELSAWNARKCERELLHADVVRLDGLRDQVGRIEHAERDVADAGRKLAATKQMADASAARREAADKELAAATESLGRARESSARLQSAELLHSNIARQVKDRQALDDLRGTIRAQARKHEEAEQKLRKARENIRDMKAGLADLQRAYIEGHAAQLAKKLVKGEPCPVCGAVEHPAPAKSGRPVPPWEQVEERQVEVDQKEKEADSLVSAANAMAADLAGKRATEQALIKALGGAGGEPLPALIEKQQSAWQQFEAASKASQQTPELAQAVENSKAKRDRAAAAHEQLLQGSRAAETESIQGVPESLRTVKKLEVARAVAIEKLKNLDQAIEFAEKALQAAAEVRHAAAEKKTSAETELQAAVRVLEQSACEFARMREEAGFRSEHELAAAKLNETQVRGLEERIAAHEQAAGAARVRAERAAVAAAGILPPDVDGLSLRLAEVKGSLEKSVALKATAEENLKQIDQLIGNIVKANQQLAGLEAEYSVVGKVADVATGNNSARLTFQRFVLSSMLDQVLETASVRLRLMSAGRYQLRRKLVPADQRSHGGLDLEVLDAHTGICRAAETLSGGESFLASLSLALGLADVVAQHAGSIRMETMFIDEGFGALDAEALELAIRTLIDLMQDGRIVGIISHVPELRERIDARLEIVATRGGSVARFVAPAPPAAAPPRTLATLFDERLIRDNVR